ncbi:MAG: hypothetical protein DRJ09_06580 [Bacteroidetes bacterium]|nr:MAG: hypothetical protein DRJ09_06580 [Bacteroidota bacterium]
MKTITLLILSVFLTISSVNAQLIPVGSGWKYLDDGSNQGTAWQTLNFDDSHWAEDNAQLGYGDSDETTVISYGNDANNKYITYYFRKKITVQDPSAQNGLKLEILRDDGAVIYINGNEVVRSNMPSGVVTSTTLAAHTVSGSAEDEFFVYNISSSCLVQGQNIVAVEIHQRSKTSSDVSFDLKLNFTQLSLFRKAPYVLYLGTNTEILILWQLNETGNCQFE